ncbi:hypothetical protein NYE62_03510 [Bacillus sp. FSL K6-2861]|uniref:hypothetical protein n=1 Tax=Bacillus sp. FSL K6-2861 TaxID=2975294 RepID=UPI00315A6E81
MKFIKVSNCYLISSLVHRYWFQEKISFTGFRIDTVRLVIDIADTPSLSDLDIFSPIQGYAKFPDCPKRC